MSRPALWLHHGRTNGGAVPEGAAVAGATPAFGCLVRHGDGRDVHGHPTLASGRSRSIDPMREGQKASRNGRVPALAPDAGQPDGQVVGQRVLQRLEAALDTLRDGLLAGSDPQRRGGWGCPAPSPLAPIEVLPRWGSLPATSKERRLASALRWPWCNRKRATDMDGRSRVRPNGDFVSGYPQK